MTTGSQGPEVTVHPAASGGVHSPEAPPAVETFREFPVTVEDVPVTEEAPGTLRAKVETVISGIQGYTISQDGKKVLYHAMGTFGIIDAAPGKKIGDVKIVLNGAGAAGIACVELLKSMGARHENCIACDACIDACPSASTPTIRIPGMKCLSQQDTPAAIPPPPIWR